MAKVLSGYSFSQIMRDALDELVHKDRMLRLSNTRTGWLEISLERLIREILKGKVNQKQIDVCKTPDDIFKLFVIFSRALRGEEDYKLVKGVAIKLPDEDAIKVITHTNYERQVADLDDAQLVSLLRADGLHPEYMELVKSEIMELVKSEIERRKTEAAKK